MKCFLIIILCSFVFNLYAQPSDTGGGGGGSPFGKTHNAEWDKFDQKTKDELNSLDKLNNEFFELPSNKWGNCFSNMKATDFGSLYIILSMKKLANGQLKDPGADNRMSFKEFISYKKEHHHKFIFKRKERKEFQAEFQEIENNEICKTENQPGLKNKEKCFTGLGKYILKDILASPNAVDYFRLKNNTDEKGAKQMVEFYKDLL